MGKLRRHALLIGTDPRDEWTATAFDHRRDVMAHVTPHAISALRLAESLRFDLVLVSDFMQDLELEEFLTAARREDCGCRQAGIVVVIEDTRTPTAQDLLALGANRVIVRSRAPELLASTINDLMAVSPRAPVRTPVQLYGNDGVQQNQAVLENISMSGMLVTETELYPEGTSFGFQVALRESLPEIQGTARVVRHTRPEKEEVSGFGATFEALEGAGNEILASFMLFAVA
ncbi:MAG: hypothetical protein GY906_35435 [bacterium]|nr:hypothetical protein [bacterium]